MSDNTKLTIGRIEALDDKPAAPSKAVSPSSRVRELEAENQRLREANRRLQAKGPALERDQLILQLRARAHEALSSQACPYCVMGYPVRRDVEDDGVVFWGHYIGMPGAYIVMTCGFNELFEKVWNDALASVNAIAVVEGDE